jgi:3-deoxy-D-manno-octulosonic-acid transferase
MYLVRFIYSLLSYLYLPVAILKLLKKQKTKRLGERLGFVPKNNQKITWIHCVSVGEFLAARVLIDALLSTHKILITTTTQTASDQVLKTYSTQVMHLYFPFDCPDIIQRFIRRIRPEKVLIMETEIWPNLLHYLHKKQIPSFIINARLSEKSFKKYHKYPNFSRETLNKISKILTQDTQSQARFSKLGVEKNILETVGNIKFDQKSVVDAHTIKQLKSFIGARQVVCFASTHENEEAQIFKAYLKNPFSALLLIIPRHPERFELVYELAKSQNLSIVKRSQISTSCNTQVLLGDSMGEMMQYFSLSDVVFMGGSLNLTGGHNMLEPAALSKAILFGNNVFNFTKIAHELLQKNAAYQVQNADELLQKIHCLLNDSDIKESLGNNAKNYFQSQQGALAKILMHIT